MVEEAFDSVFEPAVQALEMGISAPSKQLAELEDLGQEDRGQKEASRTSECKRRIFAFWCFFPFVRRARPTVPTATPHEHR